MEKPLVSVVMPTFHQPQYLKTAILSVIAQTYPNSELIIVGVKGDAESYDKVVWFSNVHWIWSEKASVVHQMNIGLKEAKGEYITEAASDDFMLPNKLASEVKIAQEKNALLVSSSYFYGDEDLTPVATPHVPPFSYDALLHRNIISDCSLVSRKVYGEFGDFDESLGVLCMFDKWLRLAEKHPDGIVQNPSPTWIYRQHPKQLHRKRLEQGNFDVYRKIITDSMKRMGKPVPADMQFKIMQA